MNLTVLGSGSAKIWVVLAALAICYISICRYLLDWGLVADLAGGPSRASAGDDGWAEADIGVSHLLLLLSRFLLQSTRAYCVYRFAPGCRR